LVCCVELSSKEELIADTRNARDKGILVRTLIATALSCGSCSSDLMMQLERMAALNMFLGDGATKHSSVNDLSLCLVVSSSVSALYYVSNRCFFSLRYVSLIYSHWRIRICWAILNTCSKCAAAMSKQPSPVRIKHD
jgi:hypothetical protein